MKEGVMEGHTSLALERRQRLLRRIDMLHVPLVREKAFTDVRREVLASATSTPDGERRPPYSPDLQANRLAYALSRGVDGIKSVGKVVGGISKFFMHAVNSFVYGVPGALMGALAYGVMWEKTAAAIFLATPGVFSLPVLAAFVAAGYALGGFMYYLAQKDETVIKKEGFGPRFFNNKPNTLGEVPATRGQLSRVIKRVGKLVTGEEFRELGYSYEEKDDGFCAYQDGKIYVVLNKKKGLVKTIRQLFWKTKKEKEREERNASHWQGKFFTKDSRDPYSLAHELGHAIEFHSFQSTGNLAKYHESHPRVIEQMVEAVLLGLGHSWFHDNSPPGQPHPLDSKIERLEAEERAHDAWKALHPNEKDDYAPSETSDDVKAERDYHQEKWSYAELFAEVTALYLLRPDWFKANYPDAALLYSNIVNSSRMVKHLHIQ